MELCLLELLDLRDTSEADVDDGVGTRSELVPLEAPSAGLASGVWGVEDGSVGVGDGTGPVESRGVGSGRSSSRSRGDRRNDGDENGKTSGG